MKQKLLSTLLLLFIGFLLQAQTVWNGPLITFTKAPNADPALAANQDRIHPSTWITRAVTGGIYNAAVETGYTSFSSPANTEWADGTLANYATLTYQNWQDWGGGAPNIPSIVGRQAVLHLIAQNIYIGIKFTAWGQRAGAGGSFSYERTTAPPALPVTLRNFGAARNAGGILLSWQTASEQNSASFLLERSTDGRSFAPLGTVAAAGESNRLLSYSFTDAAPALRNFYRLRSDDRDGRWRYSAVVMFSMEKSKTMVLSPMPATDVLHVQTTQGSGLVQVIDQSGHIRKQTLLPVTQQAFTLAVDDLSPGLYFLRIGSESRAFIKQ